jgi:hypothetical protein
LLNVTVTADRAKRSSSMQAFATCPNNHNFVQSGDSD